jgi:hypothetical protein
LLALRHGVDTVDARQMGGHLIPPQLSKNKISSRPKSIRLRRWLLDMHRRCGTRRYESRRRFVQALPRITMMRPKVIEQ